MRCALVLYNLIERLRKGGSKVMSIKEALDCKQLFGEDPL